MSALLRIVAALAAVATMAPAFAQVAPPLPIYAGDYQPQGVDERGLWREDDESEHALAASPIVIQDEALTRYVKGVLCATVGQDRCGATRVYVVREPTFNANMSPNGTMRVFSGLLLRVHNEAELGAVLGHEFAHFERRHSLNRFKATRSGTDLLAWTALLASMSPGYHVRNAYQDLQLSVYGRLYRYDRDQEREADKLSLSYLNRSGLRPQAAATNWTNLMAELRASATARGLKRPNFRAIAFTASHPPLAEREAYLTELAAPDGSTRPDGAARYQQAIAHWLPEFLDDQIRLNDFGGSDYIIQSLARDGWTAPLWFGRGELYRMRGAQRDFAAAGEFYGKAIAIDPTSADSYRGLGLCLLKTGRPSEGQQALRRYLQLKPAASDAALIDMLIPKEEASQ